MGALKKIGVIGLGSMGMGSAQSLVKAGFEVFGYDLNQQALATLKDLGAAKVGLNAAEDASEFDVLMLIVVNFDQIDHILLKSDLYKKLKPDCLVVVHSTIASEKAKYIEAKLSEVGITLIDAPISGGAAKAKEGKLTIMASANLEAQERITNVFEATAERVYWIGEEIGLGSTVKTIHQLLAGVHIAAAAESMALAAKANIPLDVMYDVVTHAAGNSWMYENRMKKVLSGDYTPNSMVDIFVKDLGLVLETGHAMKFPLPLASTAHQMFLAASSQGFGKEDDSAVIKTFKGINLPGGN